MPNPLALLSIAAALVLAVPAAAQAVSDADRADGRCAASMSMAGDAVTGEDRTALEAGMMFYLGRISGRSGTDAIAAALEAGAEGLEDADLAALTEQCASTLEAVGGAM